ncbi:MAG: cytochrome P460 family protein [Gemmatimonadota bacterium]|nr:cytochrome P460 family protein [Gemmatimonadota bacterium]MDH3367961.1 cytochrome P460 family protein [Gemmatimonadota bacterium]MDH3479205.1 cytochrome P460 family protein [Gemmatimonadota bacterium]MDH3569870.1 cytochrome P460 family protein [Gemmatimonadota bacterium]
MSRFITAVAAIGVLGLGACAQDERAEPQEGTPPPAQVQVASPDTTASALWAHVEQAGYRTTWPLWPGKAKLYKGTEPHGMLLTTYLNSVALDAVTNKAGRMPAGAVVVKENYMPDSTLAAITIMYKSPGYNPDFGNWFFVKRLASGTVEASGRVPGCQGCHASQAANDYLFTGSISQ